MLIPVITSILFVSFNNLVLPSFITIDARMWSISHFWGILSVDAHYGRDTSLTTANIISTVRLFHLTHIWSSCYVMLVGVYQRIRVLSCQWDPIGFVQPIDQLALVGLSVKRNR